jgi:hypothetical protein
MVINIDEIIKQVQVIICEPVTPIFLPKYPEAIEPNKGNIIIDKYIYVLSDIVPLTTFYNLFI